MGKEKTSLKIKYIIKEGTINEMGTKGYNLNVLKQKGIKVPEFFCLNSWSFEEALDFRKQKIMIMIEDINFEDEENIIKTSEDIINTIKQIRCWELEDKVNVFLREKFKEGDLFSIRSSSTFEDLQQEAAKRHYKYFSNVLRKDVFEYIRKCWYSMYSVEALKYFHEKKLDISKLRMAVLIQPMQKNDISGISYTSNPKGLLNEAIFKVGSGTCEEILATKVATTTYHYHKNDNIIFFERESHAITLSNEQLQTLINETSNIEEKFGKYTEVEWSLCGNELYILQAKEMQDLKDSQENIVLDNRDIVEKFPGVILPLTESFIRDSYREIFLSLLKKMTTKEEMFKKYEEQIGKLLHCVNGRLYCNVSNWNLFLQLIPNTNQVLPVWQNKMGLLDTTQKNSKVKKGFEKKLTFGESSAVSKNGKRLLKTNKKNMDELIENFQRKYDDFHKRYHKEMDIQDLLELYKEYIIGIFKDWDYTFVNEIYHYTYLELLKVKLKKVKTENSEQFVLDYLSNLYRVETEKMIRAFLDIVNKVDDTVATELEVLKTDLSVKEYLEKENNELVTMMNHYLKEYGDVMIHSFKIASHTELEYPILFIKKILEYYKNQDRVKIISNLLLQYQNENLPTILKKSAGLFDKISIQDYEKIFKNTIFYLQTAKMNQCKVYSMVRMIFYSIAQKLYYEDKITSISDIYYLHIQEIVDKIEGKEIDLKAISLNRRQEYLCYLALPNYTHLVFAKEIFNMYYVNISSLELESGKQVIKGIPVSEGVTEKEVIVVREKEDLKEVKDKIIIADTINFEWFTDISLASGIVTEYGSNLDSIAILARNIRIPYITGIKNIATTLKTGDRIKMNGKTGEITRK